MGRMETTGDIQQAVERARDWLSTNTVTVGEDMFTRTDELARYVLALAAALDDMRARWPEEVSQQAMNDATDNLLRAWAAEARVAELEAEAERWCDQEARLNEAYERIAELEAALRHIASVDETEWHMGAGFKCVAFLQRLASEALSARG